MKRSLLATSAAALLTAGVLAGCSQPFHGGAAAVVGDSRISSSQLRGMVDRGLAAVPAGTPKPETTNLEQLDLTQLVVLEVLKKMAKDLKAQPVTEAQIDAELTTASQGRTLEDLQKGAATQGVDAKSLRTFAEVVAYERAVVIALPIAQDKVRAAYDAAKAQEFEQVHVAHILVATKADADSIYAQLQADPTKFAALATQFSTDAGSKDNGGDLGFVSRDGLDVNFANAAFAGKDGTTIGPVQSSFGFHIIKVIAHKTISLEEAAPQLRLQLNSGSFVDAYKAAADKLSISVNPRYGTWVPGGGSDGLGDVEASDKGALSTPVSPTASPTASPTSTTGK